MDVPGSRDRMAATSSYAMLARGKNESGCWEVGLVAAKGLWLGTTVCLSTLTVALGDC
jgi:hypothetical protein